MVAQWLVEVYSTMPEVIGRSTWMRGSSGFWLIIYFNSLLFNSQNKLMSNHSHFDLLSISVTVGLQ
jgi:hypothetical protein